jgi:hypothetical protein
MPSVTIFNSYLPKPAGRIESTSTVLPKPAGSRHKGNWLTRLFSRSTPLVRPAEASKTAHASRFEQLGYFNGKPLTFEIPESQDGYDVCGGQFLLVKANVRKPTYGSSHSPFVQMTQEELYRYADVPTPIG